MLSCLSKIKNICTAVTTRSWHYHALDTDAPYCVWAEDSEVSGLNVDNYKGGQIISGTIDYFTRDENDTNVETFQKELNKARVVWYLNSVQFEDETGFIHYEWVWRIKQELGDGNL